MTVTMSRTRRQSPGTERWTCLRSVNADGHEINGPACGGDVWVIDGYWLCGKCGHREPTDELRTTQAVDDARAAMHRTLEYSARLRAQRQEKPRG